MITIRPAREADLPEILLIYNDIILHTTAVYDYHPHTPDMRRAWYEGKMKDGYPVFVAEEEGKVVGFSSMGPFRAWAAYKYTVENSIYVASDRRGKGIGKALLQHMAVIAREHNCFSMHWEVLDGNMTAIDFYRSLGARIGNRWLPVLLMGRAFEELASEESLS